MGSQSKTVTGNLDEPTGGVTKKQVSKAVGKGRQARHYKMTVRGTNGPFTGGITKRQIAKSVGGEVTFDSD